MGDPAGAARGRRMAERAAHLTDHVFPYVPMRHWAFTLISADEIESLRVWIADGAKFE